MSKHFRPALKHFGLALKMRRQNGGYKQVQIEAATKIKQNTLSGWEHRPTPPADKDSLEKLRVLAEFYGVDVSEILAGNIELSWIGNKTDEELYAAEEFALSILDYIPMSSYPVVLEFVKELAKSPSDYHSDLWRFARVILTGHREVLEAEKARILGTAPKTIHEPPEEYSTDVKEELG